MANGLMDLEGLEVVAVDHQDSCINVKAYMESTASHLCPKCNVLMQNKGKRTTVYRDLPIGFKHVNISVKRDRFVCALCKHEEMAVSPLLNERRKCTERMINVVKIKSLTIPFFDLSGYTGLEASVIKSMALEYAKELEETIIFETPKIMSINRVNILDETRYLITNIEKQCMFNIFDAASDVAFKNYLKGLSNRKFVTWVFEDLHLPLREVLHTAFPNARSVIHKAKVVELMNRSLIGECRLREIVLDSRRKDLTNRLIKVFTRKRASDLTQADKKDLSYAYGVIPEFRTMFQLKEDLLSFYEICDAITARFSIKIWVDSIPKKLPLLTNFSQIVVRSLEEIMHYWDVPDNIRDSYVDSYESLNEILSYVSHTHNYRIVRARLLYDDTARKLTALDSVVGGYTEYGASLKRLQERIG